MEQHILIAMTIAITASIITPCAATNEKYINEADELINFVYDNNWNSGEAPAFACCIVLMEIRDILKDFVAIEGERLILQKMEINYTRAACQSGYNSPKTADEIARSTPNKIYS